MRRALILSIGLHVLFSGWWLQRLAQRPPEPPSRFEVVIQSAPPVRPARAERKPHAPVAPAPIEKPPPPSAPVRRTRQPNPVPSPVGKWQPPEPASAPASQAVPLSKPESARQPVPVVTAAPQPLPPRTAARFHNPRPWYPRMARRRGMEGRVELQVTVAIDGSVRSIRIARSSGYRLLDEAALETVRQWRFEPARLAGMAVEGRLMVPIRFRLRDAVVGME